MDEIKEIGKGGESMEKKWKFVEEGENYVLRGKGFFISYYPNPRSFIPMFQDETALVLVNLAGKNRCLILNGDFRKEYEEVIDQGLEACLAVFQKHKANMKAIE